MPKEPLTDEEQDLLIDAARRMGEYRYAPGSTPVSMERSVLFLLDTGCHPSVLSDVKSDLRVERKGEKVWIVWNRPKKTGHAALTRVPASTRISPWVEEFVATPRPRFRQFYNALLSTLAHSMVKSGLKHRGLSPKNLSPLALRHTFGVNLVRHHIPDSTVKQLMNCSESTLRYYAKFREEMIEEQMDAIGW